MKFGQRESKELRKRSAENFWRKKMKIEDDGEKRKNKGEQESNPGPPEDIESH